jgi:hypothetical protein
MKVKIWYTEQNGTLLKYKACYCLNLNEKTIVRGGQHNENYGVMDLQDTFFGWGVLFITFIYRFHN